MIARPNLLNKLLSYRDKSIIKVITGVRRSGKSTLLELFQQYLLDHQVPRSNIISINFDDYDFSKFRNPAKLYRHLQNLLKPGMNYILLDEIQMVTNFQEVVGSLFLKKNVDLYITGSNASLLSGELASLLSGRYIEINVLPLSFKEYMESKTQTGSLSKNYAQFLQIGGFPFTLQLDDQIQVDEYLKGLYSTIVLKDVMGHSVIHDTMMLESIIHFTFDSIGSILSTKKISDTMTSFGRKVNVRTVESYLSALMNAYVVYQAKRYDVRGKQYLKSLEKYYVVDLGLRNAILGRRNLDAGHMLENIVYLELIRRGYTVHIGKIDAYEIDFVATTPNQVHYYQVAASVRNSETLQRELRPLQRVPDSYPKFLLTLDEDMPESYEGIQKINALEFFMNE